MPCVVVYRASTAAPVRVRKYVEKSIAYTPCVNLSLSLFFYLHHHKCLAVPDRCGPLCTLLWHCAV